MKSIKYFKNIEPHYEGILYEGTNIEDIICFAKEETRKSDFEFNKKTGEYDDDEEYQPIILRISISNLETWQKTLKKLRTNNYIFRVRYSPLMC